MKYKVGDKVRVRDDLVVGKNYGNGYMFRNDMVRYMGKEVTISRVGDDFYKIKDDVDYWSWVDEMFEEIKMKYKVGDKVRVRTDLIEDKVYGAEKFVSGMSQFKGKTCTIKKIHCKCYILEEDDDKWYWSDEMFEDVTETTTDGKVQTVDVGYDLTFCGHGVLVDVYQDGSHDEKAFFTSADGFNQYILPKDAIKWVIPHEKEIDL